MSLPPYRARRKLAHGWSVSFFASLLGGSSRCLSIGYRTKKSITNGRAASWKHDFGEETGRRPQVTYDKHAKRILFSGGEYTIEAPGIIN